MKVSSAVARHIGGKPKGRKVMMPKLKASHSGLYWLIVLAFIGTLTCFPSYAQILNSFDDLDDEEGEYEEENPSIAFLRLRNFRATPTLATDGPDDVDTPLIALTWTNPPDKIIEATAGGVPIYQLALYKSTRDFPTGPLDGIRISLQPGEEAYLDREVQNGVTYYYTLIGDVPDGIPEYILEEYPDYIIGEFPQMRYAKATAGTDAPNMLTASYGYDPFLGEQKAFDLAHTQITIRPVGPPLAPLGEEVKGADYSMYEATVKREVFELPVQRTDAEGGAFTLTPFNRNSLLRLGLGDMRFPFFGVEYDSIYISGNGYIVFDDFFRGLDSNTISIMDLLDLDEVDYNVVDVLDMPNLAGHFMVPRISFLFAWMMFETGGSTWSRMLSDRVVVTFEQSTEWFYDPFYNPTRNTVQAELFYSGEIRITFLQSFVYYGIVGISDGRGTPVDPTQVFDDVEPAYGLTDFYNLTGTPKKLSINPVAPPVVLFGKTAAFTTSAVAPPDIGTPRFTATWSHEGQAPFTDVGDGAGEFYWNTDFNDIGAHTVRVLAQADGMKAYQDVRVIVEEEIVLPSAVDLLLSTNTQNEDPSVSRSIAPGLPLIASYTYYHPYRKQLPMLYEEGLYILYWFRNGQVVSSFTNYLTVPSHVPQPGEKWRFQVTPITVSFLFGKPATSPVVTVLSVPEVNAVTPAQGLTIGGDTVRVSGKYFANPLSVRFGDVPATSMRVISDSELEVITPLHPAGKVTVSVETLDGIGRLVDAFSFVGDEDDEEPGEDDEDAKQRRILGCGSGGRASGSGHAGNMLLAGAAAFILAIGDRRRKIVTK